VIQSGITPASGSITMLLPGAAAQLQLLVNGEIVARYDVVLQTIGLEPAETKAGQQQRLRLLGFQIGHAGPSKDGVTGDETPIAQMTDKAAGEAFERSVLDFQVEIGGVPGNSTIIAPLAGAAGA
jgi:hypothetical protein